MGIEKLVNNGVNIIGEAIQKTSPKTSIVTKAIQGGEEQLILAQKALASQGAASVKTSKLTCDKPNKINLSQIESHHRVNGSNCSIRNDIEEYGISRMAMLYDEEFRLLEPTKTDIIAYRGRGKHPVCSSLNKDFEIIEKAEIGDTIVPDTAYSYLAFHKNLAENFMSTKDGIMYEIKIPKGSCVSRNLEHGGEILMPRGAKYKLISKSKDSQGVTNVVLEYIPEEIPTQYTIESSKVQDFVERFFRRTIRNVPPEKYIDFLAEEGIKVI